MEQLPLRDIHLPEPVSVWPLAWGWYGLILLSIMLVILILYILNHLKQRAALKTASKMLASIKQEHVDGLQSLVALSIWLRRVAISIAPRTDVASLTGSAWLSYLDHSFSDAPFSQGIGSCLADCQYRQTLPENIEIEQVFKLCEQWLAKQKPVKSSPYSFFNRRSAVKG